MIKRNETVEYYIEMSGADEGIARLRLEYSTDGGQRWICEKDSAGDEIDYTGTAADPLVGLVVIGRNTNNSGKDRVYRWRCLSMNRATSATVPAYIYSRQSIQGSFMLDTGLGILWDNEAPNDGIDGDGVGYAGKGSLYIDTSTGLIYRNDGDTRLANWVTV